MPRNTLIDVGFWNDNDTLKAFAVDTTAMHRGIILYCLQPYDQKDDADPTTVLVSAVIGDYEQAQAPAGAGHGTVLLRPTGEAELNGHRRPTILGVHTHAPVPGSMEEWLASVEVVVGQCRGDGSDGAGRVLLAGM